MGVLDFIGDIAGAGVDYYNQKQMVEWQKEQYYHNLEYNKPINQMARLVEAGINPHMAYSKGTINNIATPVPNLSAPQLNTNFVGKLEQLINMKKMGADIQNMEETNKNLKELNGRISAEARKANAEARIAEHDAEIIEKTPLSSRATETQSLAQIFGPYIEEAKKGYLKMFDWDSYGWPFWPLYREQKKPDYPVKVLEDGSKKYWDEKSNSWKPVRYF